MSLATILKDDKAKAGSVKNLTKIVLVVEYDGTRYCGFQFQNNAPTIQEELEKAILKLTGENRRVVAASRTDTGVHAMGQVVSFRVESSLPLRAFIGGLNYYLPVDIAVKTAYKARDSFDVRRNARSREYNYYILNSETRSPVKDAFSYRVRGVLDIEAMNRACQALIGRHDFISFATCLDEEIKSTVRNVYKAEVTRDGETVIFKIVANAFLPHQVRNTVGALLRVGLGKMSVDEFCNVLEAREPGLAGPTVPASGLFLTSVNYLYPLGESDC